MFDLLVLAARAAKKAGRVTHTIEDNQQAETSTRVNLIELDERSSRQEGTDAEVEILDQLEEDSTLEVLEELEAEPEKGPDTTLIQFRLFGPKTVKRRFKKTQTVRDLFLFVKHQVEEARTKKFDLICYPDKSLQDVQNHTLLDQKLGNTALRAVYI